MRRQTSNLPLLLAGTTIENRPFGVNFLSCQIDVQWCACLPACGYRPKSRKNQPHRPIHPRRGLRCASAAMINATREMATAIFDQRADVSAATISRSRRAISASATSAAAVPAATATRCRSISRASYHRFVSSDRHWPINLPLAPYLWARHFSSDYR
jgi:hypothetical protein